MPEFEYVTLRDPSSALTATYVPNAGMVGTSLSDDAHPTAVAPSAVSTSTGR